MGYVIKMYKTPTSENPIIIYDPAVGVLVSGAELSLGLSSIDNLTITANQKSPLYKDFKEFSTHVEVYQDNELIFRGRGISRSHKMEDSGLFTREFTFESNEAYLLDTTAGYYKNINITPGGFLKHVIDHHNDIIKKDKYKQFVIGTNDFNSKKTTTQSFEIDYSTSKDAIFNILLSKAKGYISFEYKKDPKSTNYINEINYLNKPGKLHTEASPIKIGSNIKSITRSINVQDVATRVIPLGEEKKPKKIALGDDSTVDSEGSLSGATHKVHGSWRDAIKHAAALMNVNVTSGEISNILALIKHESGGNEHAVNPIPVPVNGHLEHARGLVQFLPSTFKYYMVKGFTNQNKGFDCLIAAFNAPSFLSDARNWPATHSWSPSGSPRYSRIPHKYASKKHMKSLNKWGWPFPRIGEGHFASNQLFGYHPGNGRKNNFHDGLDFGSIDHPGSEIHAIHGGTVHLIGYRADGAGWYVVTHSRDGYDIVYQEAFSSKSNIRVKKGQTIKTGTVIGVRTTSHVHIGVVKKPYSWWQGYMGGHSFSKWHWLDPLKLIKHGGQKGDKNSSSKYYTEKKTKKRYDITKINKGKNYIDIPDLQKEFGLRYRYLIYDKTRDPKKLMAKAEKWIAGQKKDIAEVNYELNVIELPNHQPYKVGDQYYFIDVTGEIEKQKIPLMIVSKKINIVSNPYDVSITVGKRPMSLASYEVDLKKRVDKKISNLSSIIDTQNTTISGMQNETSGLSDVVDSNDNSAKRGKEQNRFDIKLIRRDLKKYKKQTDKHLKQIDDTLKKINETLTKITTKESDKK